MMPMIINAMNTVGIRRIRALSFRSGCRCCLGKLKAAHAHCAKHPGISCFVNVLNRLRSVFFSFRRSECTVHSDVELPLLAVCIGEKKPTKAKTPGRSHDEL